MVCQPQFVCKAVLARYRRPDPGMLYSRSRYSHKLARTVIARWHGLGGSSWRIMIVLCIPSIHPLAIRIDRATDWPNRNWISLTLINGHIIPAAGVDWYYSECLPYSDGSVCTRRSRQVATAPSRHLTISDVIAQPRWCTELTV